MSFVLVNSQEYCEYETFSPSCAPDEVVVINDATYGRMKVGKCIPEEFASYTGCSVNALPFMDNYCSGRRSCSIHISQLVADHQGNCPLSPCRSYLEVSFSCVKGYASFIITHACRHLGRYLSI